MEYLQYRPLLVMICSIIAVATPTPKDDAWIAKFYKVIEYCGFVFGRAKDK